MRVSSPDPTTHLGYTVPLLVRLSSRPSPTPSGHTAPAGPPRPQLRSQPRYSQKTPVGIWEKGLPPLPSPLLSSSPASRRPVRVPPRPGAGGHRRGPAHRIPPLPPDTTTVCRQTRPRTCPGPPHPPRRGQRQRGGRGQRPPWRARGSTARRCRHRP